MGTKTVRLEEDVYERIKDKKREDETFSEAIDRIVDDYTLVDFAEDVAEIDPDFSVEAATDGAVGATPPPTER